MLQNIENVKSNESQETTKTTNKRRHDDDESKIDNTEKKHKQANQEEKNLLIVASTSCLADVNKTMFVQEENLIKNENDNEIPLHERFVINSNEIIYNGINLLEIKGNYSYLRYANKLARILFPTELIRHRIGEVKTKFINKNTRALLTGKNNEIKLELLKLAIAVKFDFDKERLDVIWSMCKESINKASLKWK